MFRPASRVLLRPALFRPIARPSSRKLLSTASPAEKSRSWKNSAVRWGLAAAAVYYYNTHDVFAEEPAYTPPATEVDDGESLLTIEQIAAQRRTRLIESKESASNSIQVALVGELVSEDDSKPTVEGLEQEADQQGAFNPETGEINWDCPCLGGMANGPCGEEFKAAFSCFVYSKEEPKGMDCVDKFKGMQDCFRLYPDIYGAELEDDDDDVSADDVSADELGVPAASPESAVVPGTIPQTPSPAGAAILSSREEKEASGGEQESTPASDPAFEQAKTEKVIEGNTKNANPDA